MLNQSSKVSIVVPTYNHGHLIDRCLNSIINQTYKNIEVIIIDNHSTDNTKDVVQAYQTKITIQYLLIQNDGVIAKSRNLGIQNSTGDYIAFLDSDDWWLPEKLEKSILYMNQGYDLVYHDMFLVNNLDIKNFYYKKMRTRILKKPIYEDLLKNGNGINNSSVCVRKSILERVGLLSEDRKCISWEDYDYWVRISKITEKFHRVPQTLGYYWSGGGNITNPNKTLENIKNIIEHYFQKSQVLPWWIQYMNLLSYYQLNDYLNFMKNFNLLKKEVPFKQLIKSYYLLLKIIYKNIFSKNINDSN